MRLQQYITEVKITEPEQVIDILKKDCIPFLKELKKTGRKKILYRGYYDFNSGIITKKKTRNDRTPKDMDETTSEYLDNLFKKKFGWYARSAGIFATANVFDTYEYGKPFLFFPIGKYKYIWSPVVNDLYTKIDNKGLSLEDVEERFSEDYEMEQGEYTNNGSWEYDGIELEYAESRSEAKMEMMDNQELFGFESWNDFDEDLLEFIPDLTLEEFIEQKEEEIEYHLKDLVSSYTNKNLKQAIQMKNEITFNCKEYYLVLESLDTVLKHEFF